MGNQIIHSVIDTITASYTYNGDGDCENEPIIFIDSFGLDVFDIIDSSLN